MTQEEWKAVKKERATTIEQIKAHRKKRLKPEYYEMQKDIIPCCGNCEFYFSSGNCAGGIVGDTKHAYGHKVTDSDDVCLSWDISYSAYCTALKKHKAR